MCTQWPVTSLYCQKDKSEHAQLNAKKHWISKNELLWEQLLARISKIQQDPKFTSSSDLDYDCKTQPLLLFLPSHQTAKLKPLLLFVPSHQTAKLKPLILFLPSHQGPVTITLVLNAWLLLVSQMCPLTEISWALIIITLGPFCPLTPGDDTFWWVEEAALVNEWLVATLVHCWGIYHICQNKPWMMV